MLRSGSGIYPLRQLAPCVFSFLKPPIFLSNVLTLKFICFYTFMEMYTSWQAAKLHPLLLGYTFFFLSLLNLEKFHYPSSPLHVPISLLCYCCFLVIKSCLTLCNLMDCSPPGSSVHGISQARFLEWVSISSFRGSPWFRGPTCVSCISRQSLYHWATRKALYLDF